MSEETAVEQKPRTKKKARRRRQPVALRAFEVYLGSKTIQADEAGVSAGILYYRVDSVTTFTPVKAKVEIFARSVQPSVTDEPVARRVRYDPQLPHNESGNLTLDELADRERRRREQVEAFKDEKRNELDALSNGAIPFTPSFVGN